MHAEPDKHALSRGHQQDLEVSSRTLCPAFIGIGAQKCATTWIHANLAAHPDVFVPANKELDFFSYNYLRGFAWYRQHFAGTSEKVSGEISPSYLVDPVAADRIRAFNPGTRILVALRDPIDRAFSSHVHEVRKGLYPLANTSFETGLAENPMYLEQSRYGHHLQHWFESFERDQILVVFQEEIAAATERSLRNIYRFIGVNDEWLPKAYCERSHENVGYRSSALRDTLRFLGGTARRFGLHELVVSSKRTPVVGSLYQMNRRDFRKEVGAMQEDTRLRLIEELADDMRQLARLLGRDSLPWRSWHEVTAKSQ
ncbi:MAG: sulfotransferase [Pseudomonadota bacterium]